MKPLTKEVREFWLNTVDEEFKEKRTIIETEINSQAQDIADKKQSSMAKQCGVDKDLRELEIADKKYKDFLKTKEVMEDKLFWAVKEAGTKVSEKLARMSNVRGWNISFDGFEAKEDGIAYFINKLNSACYDEASNHVRAGHKIYNDLKQTKTACRIILNTGSDIESTVTTLKAEMSKASINLPIPAKLLQIAVSKPNSSCN